jgi:hypothetical protein
VGKFKPLHPFQGNNHFESIRPRRFAEETLSRKKHLLLTAGGLYWPPLRITPNASLADSRVGKAKQKQTSSEPVHCGQPAAQRKNMKTFDTITPAQLRRAAELKEKIESLNRELNQIFGGTIPTAAGPVKIDGRRRKMSAAAKAKLSAKLKAAWARRKAAQKK